MSPWWPDLSEREGPTYAAIADAIGDAIADGRLERGTRLPTHRSLAAALGVTVGTVTRAYSEAERRGLTVGEVGRGTFVRDAEPGLGAWGATTGRPDLIDLSLSVPVPLGDGTEAEALARALRDVADRPDVGELVAHYHRDSAAWSHRRVGADWIGRRVPGAEAERVAVTAGAQHGMAAVLAALTRPGDLLLTEALTYPGVKAVAHMLGLRTRGIPMDGSGATVDGLAQAVDAERPAAVYLLPTLQNPTAAVMPLERRRAIAELARERDLVLVEDDVHGWLHPDPPPTLASLAPDRTIYVTSTAKALAAGLRIGWILAPPSYVDRILAAVRGTIWNPAPLMAEITARWIGDGTADRILEGRRAETRARQALAREALRGRRVRTHPNAYHLWLELPDPWRRDELVAAAAQRGVRVAGAEAFAVARRDVPHAVRVCLGGPPTRQRLAAGLQVLRDLLDDVGSPGPSIL